MDLDLDTMYLNSLTGNDHQPRHHPIAGGLDTNGFCDRSSTKYTTTIHDPLISDANDNSIIKFNSKYSSYMPTKHASDDLLHSSLYNDSLPFTNLANKSSTISANPLYSSPYIDSTIATKSALDNYLNLSSSLRANYNRDSQLTAATATSTTTTCYLHDSVPLYTGGMTSHLLTSSIVPTTSTTAATATTTTTASYATSLNQREPVLSTAESRLLGRIGTDSSLNQNVLQRLFDDMRQIEDTVDSIEIPARGRCKVFMAKYGYDPFKQSPNDNPDAELAFNAGDYIMVFDDIDDDGYFIGELMDGRRGYVPSNWLDRLTGEDLFEFQATTLYKQATGKSGTTATGTNLASIFGVGVIPDDELDSNSYPPEFYDAILSDTVNHSNFQHLLAPEDYHRMNDYVDIDDVDEVDDECLSDYERAEAEQMRRQVPPPQRLVLERQLNKCILVAWLHPQTAKGTIISYQVYVDGVLKSTVPSGDRTKALLEGVDSTIPHRISVRAIDIHGRHSNDAGCTIVIGQNIPFAPSCVKASHITSDSALISWLPCNSNFHHVVAVNSVEVQTVRPGVYKHLINGLSANTLYRVWVRAKPGKIFPIDEKNPKKLESVTTYVDFKTMPKSLPDPPVNVQVEAGPQKRTLLVTWLPLTLNDFGSSNGCAVTGYAVFAGHKKLADIDSPTGDHALLDVSDLESLHKKSVTVRTKSGENLSQDSMPCQIPDEYLKTANSSCQQHQNQQSSMQQQRHLHHHKQGRLSDSNVVNYNSPRHQHRLIGTSAAAGGHQDSHYNYQPQPQQHQQSYRSIPPTQRGRQMTRSLRNLESDSESRRSSLPAIEITRETSVSDMVNQTESYSEEEFESSMRFRAGQQRGKSGANRYRPRQSHSMDGSGTMPQVHQRRSPYSNSSSASNRLRYRTSMGDVHYFVALFDYDPSTMSPNPNAAAEELAFKEGSIIKVFGGLGEDGFYKGELDNQIGYVPCNVITEITDQNLLNSLRASDTKGLSQATIANFSNTTNQTRPTKPANPNTNQQQLDGGQHQMHAQAPQQVGASNNNNSGGGVKRMIALYDYDPQENSPNADTESEIPFRIGDIIHVYGKMDGDGFYMGEVERTQQRGLVPSNFLREDPIKHQLGQQQPFNQMGPHQQRPASQMTNQPFVNNPTVQHQQQHQPTQQQPLDQSGAFIGGGGIIGGVQQSNPMQMQSQHQQLRPGVNMQGQPMQQHQQIGANINRPTTLSLTSQQQQTNGPGQMMTGSGRPGQQQVCSDMQQLQNKPVDGNMAHQPIIGGFSGPNRGQQQMGTQFGGQQQHLQHQQPGGGVLSNLLSSGKQIISGATTPRAPNLPLGTNISQFPTQQQQQHHQQPMLGQVNQMLNTMGPNQLQQTQQSQMQQPQQQSMMPITGNNTVNNIQNRTNSIMTRPGTGGSLDPTISAFGAQQQAPDLMGLQYTNQQTQQHMPQHQQQPMSMIGNQQQHLQQSQHGYVPHIGIMGRPGGMGNNPALAGTGGADDPGGNILNTVKNMFKL